MKRRTLLKYIATLVSDKCVDMREPYPIAENKLKRAGLEWAEFNKAADHPTTQIGLNAGHNVASGDHNIAIGWGAGVAYRAADAAGDEHE